MKKTNQLTAVEWLNDKINKLCGNNVPNVKEVV
jgi:hypothetical protein